MAEFIAAAGAVVGGVQDFQAAKREKKDLGKQAAVIAREGEADALRQEKIDRIMNQKVSQSFLKSGVSLEGSPALVLQAREQESSAFVASMRASTQARAGFTKDKGKRVLTAGRNKLIASGFQAGSSTAKGLA